MHIRLIEIAFIKCLLCNLKSITFRNIIFERNLKNKVSYNLFSMQSNYKKNSYHIIVFVSYKYFQNFLRTFQTSLRIALRILPLRHGCKVFSQNSKELLIESKLRLNSKYLKYNLWNNDKIPAILFRNFSIVI